MHCFVYMRVPMLDHLNIWLSWRIFLVILCNAAFHDGPEVTNQTLNVKKKRGTKVYHFNKYFCKVFFLLLDKLLSESVKEVSPVQARQLHPREHKWCVPQSAY